MYKILPSKKYASLKIVFYVGLLYITNITCMVKILDDKVQFASDDTAAVKFVLQSGEGFSIGMRPSSAPPQSLFIFRDTTQPVREEKVLLRAIPGIDGRERIHNTTDYPYSCIAHANNNQGSGSGCMVGPHHFLTAAHCVYNRGTGSFVQNFIVHCGLNDGIAPFNAIRGVRIYLPEEYIKTGSENYDIALVILDQSIGNKVGWMSFFFDEKSTTYVDKKVNITGYPGDKGGGKQMWGMTHDLKTIAPDKFFYEHDTYSGHSGSPITWEREYDMDGRGIMNHTQIIGVHTHGEGPYGTGNSGTRITAEKFKLLQGFISETAIVIARIPLIPRISRDNPREVSITNNHLMQAIINADFGLIATLIKPDNEAALDLNEEGFNALHFASYCGYIKVIEFLLSHKKVQALINKGDSEGWIPLHWGAYGNQKEVVELLLKYDAGPRRKNSDKKIPQKLTSDREIKALLHPFHPDEKERTKANFKLWTAVRMNNKAFIKEALHLGADIECEDPGTNIILDPLIRSSKGFPIQMLFDTIIKPDSRMYTRKGFVRDNEDALFYLIEQGANIKHISRPPSYVDRKAQKEFIESLQKRRLYRIVELNSKLDKLRRK